MLQFCIWLCLWNTGSNIKLSKISSWQQQSIKQSVESFQAWTPAHALVTCLFLTFIVHQDLLSLLLMALTWTIYYDPKSSLTMFCSNMLTAFYLDSLGGHSGISRHLVMSKMSLRTFGRCQCGFPNGLVGKESACSAGNTGDENSIPRLGRSPGGWNGNPVQYPCLKNCMDRVAWPSYSPNSCKELDMTERLNTQHTKGPRYLVIYDPAWNIHKSIQSVPKGPWYLIVFLPVQNVCEDTWSMPKKSVTFCLDQDHFTWTKYAHGHFR